MTTILTALVDASDHGVVSVIHTDSITAVRILRTMKGQTRTTAHNIVRMAAPFEKNRLSTRSQRMLEYLTPR